MKRIAILAALTFAIPAFAQQQRPSDDEINARIQALTAQRNAAQDQVVVLSGQAQAEVNKLQAEISSLKKAADACKMKEPEKK